MTNEFNVSTHPGKKDRMNILWFSMEDTSPRLGCYGDPLAKTPNIDRVAAEGVVFSNAFSTAGVCAPSRSSIITGMYPTYIGTHHMRTGHCNPHTPELPTPYSAVPPPHVKAFPEYLRAEGYFCTNNVKTDYQFETPFSAWDECGADAHWCHRPDPEQPFFSVFNPDYTHESGMWPNEVAPLRTDPLRVKVPPHLPDTPIVREAIARQYDNIERDDVVLGELLRQLEEAQLLNKTIIFIWSDHGEGLPRYKRWPYDGGIHVPLIVRWPGKLTPGSTDDRLVSLIDLAPTVIRAAGITPPCHLQGQPFCGVEAPRREYVFATRDRYDESYDRVRAIRNHRYKYIRHYYPEKPYLLWIPYRNRHPVFRELWGLANEGKLAGAHSLLFQDSRPPEELYDTQEDPGEIHNLAENPERAGTMKQLRQALDQWIAEYDRWGNVPEAEMVAQWHPGGKVPRTARPLFIPICAEAPGIDPANQGATYSSPCRIHIHCATEGASISYRIDSDPITNWKLYKGPIPIPRGSTTLRAIASRIGYQESQEGVETFQVTEPKDGPLWNLPSA